MMTACAHIFRSLIQCFQESLLLLLHLDTFHNMVKTGFSLLVSFNILSFYHTMHIYSGLHLQNLLHVLSIVIQQNLRHHSLLCCTFYMYLSAHPCCNTHMYILVGVVTGSSCIYNSLFCLISAFSHVLFSSKEYLSISKFQCQHFFIVLSHVRHVTRDCLKIVL